MSRVKVITAAVTAAVAAVALAACSGSDDDGLVLPAASATSPSTAAAPATTSTSAAACSKEQRVASYEPNGAITGYTAKIKRRGYLVAGISADTLLFGSRNPIKKTIEGYDIDVLKEISKGIFGSPDKIRFVVITAGQRLDSLAGDVDAKRSENGAPPVDIVARTMSITCERWKSVAFSTEYFEAGQTVLVAEGQTPDISTLNGKRVCAPAGTSSLNKLKDYPQVKAVSVARHTDCLALFQEGSVDAITGDNTVLAGFAAQDPYAVVGKKENTFSEEDYGLAMGRQNVDFVKFVNAQLQRMRTDGTLTRIYDQWLKDPLGQPAPVPPTPVYGR